MGRRTISPLLFLLALSAILGVSSSHATLYDERGYAFRHDSEEAFPAYAIGVFLMERGTVRAALPYLERAWEASSGARIVGIKLAEAYFRLGKLEESERLVDSILARGISDPDALLIRAKLFYMRGKRVECAQVLERLSELEPASFEIAQLLGKVYYEMGEDAKAVDAYGRALRLDPNYPFLQYRYGMLLKKFGREAEAEGAFEKALKLSPTFDEPALSLAGIYAEQSRFAKAESLLSAVLKRRPDNDEALVKLARIYLDRGDYDSGIRILEERKRSSTLAGEGWLLLGQLYYEAKEFDEALGVFEPLYRRGGRHPELARILGEVCLRAGKRERALRYYRDAIELAPDDYRGYLSLYFAATPRFVPDGVQPLELPGGEEDSLLASAARLVGPDDPDGYYLVGMCYQNVDSLETARRLLLEAYRLEPQSEKVLLALATVEEKAGNYEEAERHLAILYERNPDDPSVNNFYGYLLAEMGRELGRAERMVLKALEADPQNGYYLDSLGWVYYRQGRYAKALEELEKAASIVRDDPVILEHLGDAYRALKRFRKALSAYEMSRKLRGPDSDLEAKIESTRKGQK